MNGVNDTLGPPMSRVLKGIAPCKGRTSRIGATPPRHKRAGCRKMACIGGTMSTWELCTHVMRPIYARFVEGRCPYFDILPLQGAIPFKPESWGETQGAAALRSALPWAEIPLPLQGAAVSKPLKYSVFYCILIRDRGVPYQNTYNML